MKRLLPFMAVLWTLAVRAQFNEVPTVMEVTNPPATTFERLYHTTDAPLVRGMAAVPEPETLFLEVRVEKITVGGGPPAFAVSLRGRASNYTDVDYIDEDELDGLISGIQSITQAGHSVTTLDDFEVTYRTRSGFTVSKSSHGGAVQMVVRSGRRNDQRVQVEDYMLNDLVTALAAAKTKIQSLR